MRKITLDNYRKEEKEARITFERKQRENREEIDCVVNKLTSDITKQVVGKILWLTRCDKEYEMIIRVERLETDLTPQWFSRVRGHAVLYSDTEIAIYEDISTELRESSEIYELTPEEANSKAREFYNRFSGKIQKLF